MLGIPIQLYLNVMQYITISSNLHNDDLSGIDDEISKLVCSKIL